MKNMKDDWTTSIAASFATFVVLGICLLIQAFLIKLLWNMLCPELFNLPTVTLWQSLGILCIVQLLKSPLANAK